MVHIGTITEENGKFSVGDTVACQVKKIMLVVLKWPSIFYTLKLQLISFSFGMYCRLIMKGGKKLPQTIRVHTC